jgi:hypothetical protein
MNKSLGESINFLTGAIIQSINALVLGSPGCRTRRAQSWTS